jgi:DNA replication ATP-dependent helicase Dna2
MNVLNEFLEAIEIDRQKTILDHDKQMSEPLEERVLKGVTMANLKVVFDFYASRPNQYCWELDYPEMYIASARIICENNISKFKEGSRVYLSNGKYNFEMEVEEDTLENFTLKPNDFTVATCIIDATDYPDNNWEINTIKTDVTTKLLSSAAQILKAKPTVLLKVGDFINGRTKNILRGYSQQVGHLNNSQNLAYLNAINSTDFCLIQGPPGTGKTETIANITKYLLDAGLKVFITAPTHTAINNCLTAVSRIVKNSKKVIKIGEKAQNKDIQNNEFIDKKTRLSYHRSNYDNQGIAVGATPYSLCYPATKKLEGWNFDVAIIDEASQLSIPLAIAAMCSTAKYIFVGDHKQLDPIIPKESNNEMYAESIFGRLARLYPDEINLLDTSYRLNSSLIKIPNSLFYNDRLFADVSTKVDSRVFQSLNNKGILNNSSHILVLHDVFDAQGRSPFEASLVADLVSDLLLNGVPLCDIGVMSPYRAQIREIKKQVSKKVGQFNNTSLEDLFIDTVDSMQGQERDYIIYSLSNSHPLESMRRLDFFYSPNRLNVAITRAIKKCIVIGNYKIFDINEDHVKADVGYTDIAESLELFKRYYNLATKIEIGREVEDIW